MADYWGDLKMSSVFGKNMKGNENNLGVELKSYPWKSASDKGFEFSK